MVAEHAPELRPDAKRRIKDARRTAANPSQIVGDMKEEFLGIVGEVMEGNTMIEAAGGPIIVIRPVLDSGVKVHQQIVDESWHIEVVNHVGPRSLGIDAPRARREPE